MCISHVCYSGNVNLLGLSHYHSTNVAYKRMTESTLTESPTKCEIGALDDSIDFSSPASYHLNVPTSISLDSNTAYLNQVCACMQLVGY